MSELFVLCAEKKQAGFDALPILFFYDNDYAIFGISLNR